MRKYILIFLISLLIGVGLFLFLYTSETGEFPELFQHIDFLIWQIVGLMLTIWLILKISNWLNKIYSWKTSFGKRFFIGLSIYLLTGYFIISSFTFLFIALAISDQEFGQFIIQYDDVFFKGLILTGTILLFYSFIDLALFSYYQYAREKVESLRLNTGQIRLQYNALKNQLTSHFLFNSLNSISSLIYKDVNIADKFVRKLAGSYNMILNQVNYNLITIREELEIVKNYKYLMEVRFEGALDIQIDIRDEVAETLIPPLSLQLLVENAIKHNLLSEEQPLKVEISFLKNDYIQLKNNCIQKDYYIQIDNKLIENPLKNTTMIGLNNIRQRYRYYTDREIFIQRSKDFIVKLPVLNGINEKKNILT